MGDEEEGMKRSIPVVIWLSLLIISDGLCKAQSETKANTGAETASAISVTSDTVHLPIRYKPTMSVVEAMSVRRSVRKFQAVPVPFEKLSWLLHAAGSAWQGAEAPGRMIVVQEGKAFIYDRKRHALAAEPDSLVKIFGTDAPLTITFAPPAGAPETDSLWVWRGAAGQAMYLGAAASGLGTVTRGGVRSSVGLPGDTVRCLAGPAFSGNGDPDDPGRVPLESAFAKAASAKVRSPGPAVLLGKMVWAMYGRSAIAFSDGRRHRTVPSARNRYPMSMYVFSPDGVTLYDPETDRLTPVQNSDLRKRFADEAGFPAFEKGPYGFLIAWDRAKMDNRGCALYEAGSMLFDARLIANPIGIDVDWKVVADPAIQKNLIPGIQGDPFFLIAVPMTPGKTKPNGS
jgi:hypothetical protein